jgi:hypothetical protein
VLREGQRAQPKLYVLQKRYAKILDASRAAFGKKDSKAGVIEGAYPKLLVSSDLFKHSHAAIN